MGIRRMFHGDVVESDLFLDMPLAAQALYFHLGMEADIDGLVNCPRQVARRLGLGEDALTPLVESEFVFFVEDILVIRHFRQANSLKNDRLKMPRYPEISKKIFLCQDKTYSTKKEKGAVSLYTFKRQMIRENGIQMESKRNPDGIHLESQNRKEKNRKEKNRKEENGSEGVYRGALVGAVPTHDDENELKLMGGELGKGVLLMTDGQMNELMDLMGLDGFDHYAKRLSAFILERGAKVNNHYATMLKWWKEDTQGKKD